MTPIWLSDAQKFDIELAMASDCEDVEVLDADCAAYLFYRLAVGEIPDGKILGRTCEDDRCVNPEHLVLIDA